MQSTLVVGGGGMAAGKKMKIQEGKGGRKKGEYCIRTG